MRVIVVGLGIQGRKRLDVAKGEVVASVDPFNAEARYRNVEDVPLDAYDAALLCIPDEPKLRIITYLLCNGKHLLVEKPLFAADTAQLRGLKQIAEANRVTCYTAYNHRFEPHFVRMKQVIDSGRLGRLYSVRMFYGNGTARQVRDSAWRDQGAGVLSDLGSHLLDTLLFWLNEPIENFQIVNSKCFENSAPDHVVFGANPGSKSDPLVQLEVTLLSWRNHFYCDIFAENGSAHISSLCKWGPSQFTVRDRKLPSGRPDEESVTLVQPDPTWALEYEHFRRLCATGKGNTDADIWINDTLAALSATMLESHRGVPC
jgi:scyllo-inositol 2-dehydrogenase (NADP+)